MVVHNYFVGPRRCLAECNPNVVGPSRDVAGTAPDRAMPCFGPALAQSISNLLDACVCSAESIPTWVDLGISLVETKQDLVEHGLSRPTQAEARPDAPQSWARPTHIWSNPRWIWANPTQAWRNLPELLVDHNPFVECASHPLEERGPSLSSMEPTCASL